MQEQAWLALKIRQTEVVEVVMNFADIQHIKEVCLSNKLKLHLDGARLWNALVANNETPKQYGEIFDSISICLSKGIGNAGWKSAFRRFWIYQTGKAG